MKSKSAAVTLATDVHVGPPDSYDILILDAGYKQSLASARSLSGP